MGAQAITHEAAGGEVREVMLALSSLFPKLKMGANISMRRLQFEGEISGGDVQMPHKARRYRYSYVLCQAEEALHFNTN